MEPHILIVDDEVDLLETLVRLLGRPAYKCRVASSAADAILALEAEPPHLVVTDLHMPGTDGNLVNAVQRAVAQLALDRESAMPRRASEEQPIDRLGSVTCRTRI